MLRLAIVTHKVDRQDGQGRVNYEIIRAALEKGYEVTVVAEFCSDDIANHPRGRFVRMRKRSVPTQMLRNLYFAEKSARWLRDHRSEFDIIQANGFVTWEPADIVAVHFVHAAWLRNRFFPFHWNSFSPYAWYQRGLALMNAYYERAAFTNAQWLIAVSGATAKEVTDLGVPANKVRVIYNGVDIEEFRPASVSNPPQRGSFGLPESALLALFAGDIRTPRKNLEAVLTAIEAIPDAHLAVAGSLEGSPYPEYVRQRGLSERVHFVGKTLQMSALMRSVDLFVLPSRYESFGMVVLEAMASGLPVILSSMVGAVELVKGVCRVIADPDDTAELTRAIAELLHSPQTRAAMGQAGREIALQVQWSRTAGAYLAVYEECAASSASARDSAQAI